MGFNNYKDIRLWQATRRKFLKTLALIGTVSSVDLFGPFKNIGFGKEGSMSPEEMRKKAIQLFIKPKLFQ